MKFLKVTSFWNWEGEYNYRDMAMGALSLSLEGTSVTIQFSHIERYLVLVIMFKHNNCMSNEQRNSRNEHKRTVVNVAIRTEC